MRLGIAQISTRAGDLVRTGERIVAQSEKAAVEGVDLLVFPVATLAGPFTVSPIDQRGLLSDVMNLLTEISPQLACPCLVPMLMVGDEREGGLPALETFLLTDNDVMPLHFAARMRQIAEGWGLAAAGAETDWRAVPGMGAHAGRAEMPDGTGDGLPLDALGEAGEALGLFGDEDGPLGDVEANGFACFETGGLRFVVAGGFDDLYELLDFDYAVDAIIFLPIGGFAADDPTTALGGALTEGTFLQDARDAGVWIAAAGSVGCYDTSVFTGGSFIVSPAGVLVASAPSFEEALIAAELDAPAFDEGGVDASGHDGELHGEGGAPSADASRSPRVGVPLGEEGLEPELYDSPFFCWEALTLGLREFVRNAGHTDVALTLDGTLGSSVLAVLACDALGPLHVHALLATPLAQTDFARARGGAASATCTPGLRGSFAWQQLVTAAVRERPCRRLAQNLRIEPVERDTRLVVATAAALRDARSDHDRLVAAELEAGVVRAELASLAAETGALTLSSHDKTWRALEARAGEGADLLPLGDLYRTDVLELARMRNAISPVIPDVVLRACDVPCLENDEGEQTVPPARPGSLSEMDAADEALLHAVDSVLAGRVEWARNVSELAQAHGEDLVCAVLAQLERHAAARVGAGVVLRMSGTSLDEDRAPYGMAWHDRVREPEEIPRPEEFARTLREVARTLRDEEDEGSEGRRGAQPVPARVDEGVDFLGYLRDLAAELGAGGDGPDGHLATDEEGHLHFGGFGRSPFSEN